MKILLYTASIIIVFFLNSKLYSQNTYPRENIMLDADVWFGLNAQFRLDNNSISKNTFLVQLVGKHSTWQLADTDYFYQKSIHTSYERLLSQQWIGGVSLKYSELNVNKTTLGGYLRHFSPIKKINLTFWQQVAFERILANNSFYDPVSRLRFQFALNKCFKISKTNPKKKLIGTLSFELFKEIQRIEPNSERRFFQEQRIQTECFFPIYSTIYLGVFAGLHTKQFIALAQFDMNGEELIPKRRLNQRLPIFGVNVILTLGKNTTLNRRLWTE